MIGRPRVRCTVGGAGRRCGHLERAQAAGTRSPGGTIRARCGDCGARVCRDYRCSLLVPRTVRQTGSVGAELRRRQLRVCVPCAYRWARQRTWGDVLEVELAQAEQALAQATGRGDKPAAAGHARSVARLRRQLDGWRTVSAANRDTDPGADARRRAAEAM